MAKLLLVDDDTLLLDTLGLLLKGAGHEVQTATDGLIGLEKALQDLPDLVLLDLRMPRLDGFGMMAALRANEATRRLPCVLLTALDDRESLRKAMACGADGMLLKPVQPESLLQAISRRLEVSAPGISAQRPAVPFSPIGAAPRDREAELDAALGESSVRAPFKESRQMSVLFSDVRNFSRFAELLPSTDVADVLQGYYEHAARIVRAQQGLVVRIIGDALLAAFESHDRADNNHCARAIRCALLLSRAATDYAQSLERRYANRQLPTFAVGSGIHTGEVMVCSMGPGHSSEVTVIGDTVNVAAHLEARSKELGCVVIASAETAVRTDERFVRGKRERIQLKGRLALIETVEILGFAPRDASQQNVITMRTAAG